MMGRVSLVAHRGQPETFPENSLQGFAHALQAGARYIETDVHITADGIPVLSHDANLLKLTGKQIIISDHSYEQIKDMQAGFPERFGDRFNDCRIATLEQFCELMKAWPEVTCFIELKSSSMSYFGEKAVDLTLQALQPIIAQCVLISFDHDALMYAAQHYSIPLGWVLPDWVDDYRHKAEQLKPKYLFIDQEFCPSDASELWPGTWTWAAYTINTAQQVDRLAGLGIELLETDRYSDLIEESDNIDVSNDF
jgi:glycerophosphoryl diester phosphodiesterase